MPVMIRPPGMQEQNPLHQLAGTKFSFQIGLKESNLKILSFYFLMHKHFPLEWLSRSSTSGV